MKHQLFIATFLTALNNVAGKQLAPAKLETWCITYVSTYLVPLQTSSNLTEVGEATKYIDLTPTLDATTAENASSIANQLDSSASETQLVDVEPTKPPSDTDTTAEATDDTIIAPTTIDEADLTSTSNAVPVSSPVDDPAGRSIIFLISLPDNEKRDLGKRETGGFVGNENPGECTFAAVFTLTDGLLLENGVPIYYSGEEYKELSGQGQPPSDSVTKTFSSSGGGLQFINEKLPGGQAGFCQDASGKVYIMFSSRPPGCVPVDLSVYGVEQCQNGRLLGLYTPRTSSSDLTTQDVTSTGQAPGQSQTLSASSADSTSVEALTSSGPSTIGSTDTATVASEMMTSSSPGLITTTLVSPLSSSLDSPVSSATDSSGIDEAQSSSASEEGFPETTSSSDAALSDVTSGTVTDGNGFATSQNISDETATSTEPRINAPTNDVSHTSTTVDITSEVLATTIDASTTEPTTIPTVDACVSGITSPDGVPPLDVREEECSDLNVVTVSPSTVTVTEVRKRRVIRGIIVAEHVIPVTRNVAPRDDDEAATTVFPTQMPEYAAYCDSADEYYDACSSLGVTRFTTTLPTETETTTIIITTAR